MEAQCSAANGRLVVEDLIESAGRHWLDGHHQSDHYWIGDLVWDLIHGYVTVDGETGVQVVKRWAERAATTAVGRTIVPTVRKASGDRGSQPLSSQNVSASPAESSVSGDGRRLAIELSERIEREYENLGYSLGWRLLYSPASVLSGARVAFVGLNPGGHFKPADHAEFAMKKGSAYELEAWGHPPGEAPLQRQVLALFRHLQEPPEKVLAGNLVPFRSPSWDQLHNRERALAFGKVLWHAVFEVAKPSVIVAMGNNTIIALRDVLGIRRVEHIPVNWGNISAFKGQFSKGAFVGLPHLSRFGIMTRPESISALHRLFG